ncbi:DegT/DnrJ/EryC1/StrS family aminotransferase [Actinomycetota bacterium]|nr:DegT/DnrJ/EryC1/StrS family aminotransferase [Actinomycetota bacterium]
MIPYGRQSIDASDIAAVEKVLGSDYLTSGPAVTDFEEGVADYVGAKFAVSFTSATAALHAACAVIDLKATDTVVTSPLSFIASANCARYVGAQPGLADIDPHTYNINLDLVSIDAHAVIPVHYAGLPVELSKFSRQGRWVIEDASHALGARSTTEKVGAVTHSDMCVFSFHPVKPMTTGEGGMVTTNNVELAEKLRLFRSHGMVRDVDPHTWLYNAETLGYNYRLTDIQAALGLSQLHRLDSFISQRNEIAERYRELLSDLPITLPPAAPTGALHGYHLFAIHVAERARVFRELRQAGIGVQVHYVPVHHHGISTDIELPPGGLPKCEQVYEGLISIPIHPSLSRQDQDTVVREIRKTVVK